LNIWNIAVKEFKSDLRDKRTLFLMLVFPIVLMLILGSALTNAFTSGLSVDGMKLLYKNEATAGELVQAWEGFAQAIGQEGVETTSVTEGADGVKEVKEDNATAYAVIRDSGIQFYGSSRHSIESNILQGMLTAFADQYNLAAAAYRTDPEAAGQILKQAGAQAGFVQETGLEADRKPGSMDYYALVMSTMIAFYAAMSASYLIRGERLRKTALRLSAAPLKKSELFLGKVIGNTLINVLCVMAVVLFSKFVFRADWGDHMGIVLLALLTEVILAISLGLAISFIFKESSSTAVLMIFAQVASFFGGAYFPLGELNGFMLAVANASPLYWINSGMMKVIYNGDVQAALPVIGLNVGIAAVLLVFSAITIRRREAL